MRHVFETMGTVASLDLGGDAADPTAVAAVESIFATADQRFSLHRHDSELSTINRDAAGISDASPQLRDAYAVAVEWRIRTHGSFSPTKPDGLLDLNGVVKALAMRDAGAELLERGHHDWSLVVGGDLLVSGSPHDAGSGADVRWTTGIVDPFDRDALLCAVELSGSRRAIATSGSAERGDHIWTAGSPAPEFVQVTVMADDILTADVLATAIVAGGVAELRDACERWPIDVLTVDPAGGMTATPGFRSALATGSCPPRRTVVR